VNVLPIHQRLAELWTISGGRSLTTEEKAELDLCLRANALYVWKAVKLENLSLLATETRDVEWQHEVCERMEKLTHGFY